MTTSFLKNNTLSLVAKSAIVFLLALFVFFPISTNAQLSPQERARLESELAELEKEMAELNATLSSQKNKSASLQRDVQLLQTRINAAKTNIQKKDLEIKKLGTEIKDKNQTIVSLSNDIETGKENLAELVRKTNEIDHLTLSHAILSSESISDFYGDLNTYSSIKRSVHDSVNMVRGVKVKTEEVKRQLEQKQTEEVNNKRAIEQEKLAVERNEQEQKKLLDISKNQEAEYAKVLAARQAEAARIRAELIQFQGSGVESRSISFGEAYDYAKLASQKTGVDPAFIMAIMQQETGFGNNVGGCYLKEKPELPVGGVYKPDGIYIKTGNPSRKTMIPSNFDNFVKITAGLGMDWKTTPISCVLTQSDGSLFGHGGAMGYTQFIPNTWMEVEARVRSHLGISAANPWNPRDAVMATAVFIMDRGANGSASQNYNTYYNAACRYYGSCSSYATSVMNKTATIRASIDKLEF